MLDRTQAPAAFPIPSLKLIQPEKIQTGDTALYYYPYETLPVVKIDFVFDLCSYQENIVGSNYFTVKMLQEGTDKKNASQIADAFSQKGGFIEISPGIKRSTISIYSLSKHVNSLLPIVFELLTDANFPKENLDKIKRQTINTLKVNEAKSAYLATKQFNAALFGEQHLYGRKITEEQINKITKEHLENQYELFSDKPSIDVFVTGQMNSDDIKSIEQFLLSVNAFKVPHIDIALEPQKQLNIEKEIDKAVQSTIKIGRTTINKAHEDYAGLYLVNEIFGGYFGSRLMMNLREEKGLTYGIYSRLRGHKECSVFEISADVIKKDKALAQEEIMKELALLSDTLIPEDEINKVKQYISGSLLNSFNTLFDHSDKFKTVLYQNLPLDFYDTIVEKISNVTATEMQQLAQQYLSTSSMNTTVVG